MKHALIATLKNTVALGAIVTGCSIPFISLLTGCNVVLLLLFFRQSWLFLSPGLLRSGRVSRGT